MSFIKKHKTEIILFAAAFAVRIVLFLISLKNAGWDFWTISGGADGYADIAKNIAAGNGYSMSASAPFLPDSMRLPLYPLILAAFFFFKAHLAAAIFQIAAGSFIPIIGYKIASKIISQKNIAFAASLALAVEPFMAELSYVFMTETLFILLFLLAVLFIIDYFENQKLKWLASSGLLLGLATLVRPTAQYLPVLIIALIFWIYRKSLNKKIIIQSAVFLAIFLAVLSPWIFRNYKTFGAAALSSQSAFNLYGYLAPSTIALETGQNFQSVKNDLFKNLNLTTENLDLSNASRFKKESYKIILEHPAGLIKSAAITIFQFFTHDRYFDTFKDFGYFKNINPGIGSAKDLFLSGKIIFVLTRMLWIFLTAAFFCGIFSYYKNNGLSAAFLLFLIIVFYFALTSIITGLGITGRIRMPINAFILIFAFYGLMKKSA
ncbi:MAG: glycosyltransferase family 39 protein [Candidatus Pacebacteria bacterium]|nr:glycosyltransferase family 39 protein [Candidatus Paceibacterota bacterium]